MSSESLSRRGFLGVSLAAGAGLVTGRKGLWLPSDGAPAILRSTQFQPSFPSGIQSGDPTSSRAVVWSRADRPARMWVDWATNERLTGARTVRGPAALENGAFTAAVDLTDLPAEADVFYRVRFESLEDPGTFSEPALGRLRTAPSPGTRPSRRVRLAWSADEVGQGWGIDRDRGGMRIFEAMRQADLDAFIHSGDIIYADQPLEPEVELDDGTIWRNLMTEAKSKVAETLDDFRGCFAYNLLDDNARRFNAEIPMIAQWDDHEVMNNWFPGMDLSQDDRYTEKNADLLAARARQALFEFVPIRRNPDDTERIYRSRVYGDLVEVFMLDLRSYRGPNSSGRQTVRDASTSMLGDPQFAWLKEALRASQATWKIIATDLPLGLVVQDYPRNGQPAFEAWANGDDGVPLGRELELAQLLSFMKREGIHNTIWITADVHYGAAHHYSPERAAFTDFDPFWELVAGPMNAGTYGPNTLDHTFGPEVRFLAIPEGMKPNRPPSAGFQFFGVLEADPTTRVLTMSLHDIEGTRLWSQDLEPAGG